MTRKWYDDWEPARVTQVSSFRIWGPLLIALAMVASLLIGQRAYGQSQSSISPSELHGMKLAKAVSVAQEVWINTNPWPVTAVWKWTRKHFDSASNTNVETSGESSQVFKAKESRAVKFEPDCISVAIVMAYKDLQDKMMQGNAAADWKPQEPDFDPVGGEPGPQ